MRFVIIRDDDTNALTPVEYLERLYRPFLDRGMPVSLATIPNVNTEATHCDGGLELFLMARNKTTPKMLPIGENQKLSSYLKDNPGFHILQHGCRHEFVSGVPEFAHDYRQEISRRLDEGLEYLLDAGFRRPAAFVAPYDLLSRTAHEEVARRFRVVSTGWYELLRLPVRWWPRYAVKKALRNDHWRIGRTILLSHPGCHLSYHHRYDTMLDTIRRSIESRRLTVLVTHWWEYFRDGVPDEQFICVLHATAEYLAKQKDIRVISFNDLARERITLN